MSIVKRPFFPILLLLSLPLCACAYGVSDSGVTRPAPVDSSEGGSGGQPTEPASGPPAIESLQLSQETLREGQSLSIVVQVSDPDGEPDVLGGRLLDASGEVQLGLFERHQDGHFSCELSWQQLNAQQEIAFELAGSRTVQVSFIDNQRNEASRELSIALDCGGFPACQGRCGSAERPDCGSACDPTALCCRAAVSQTPPEALCSDQRGLLDDFKACVCNSCAGSCGNYCVPQGGWVSEACYSCMASSCWSPLKACFYQDGCG